MIIKVIKSSNSTWYKDFIGRLCEVRIVDEFYYIVAGNDFCLIAIDDCEVVQCLKHSKKIFQKKMI